MTASFYESTFIQCSTETELASILKFNYKENSLLKSIFSMAKSKPKNFALFASEK
jgi:hypothetical protein